MVVISFVKLRQNATAVTLEACAGNDPLQFDYGKGTIGMGPPGPGSGPISGPGAGMGATGTGTGTGATTAGPGPGGGGRGGHPCRDSKTPEDTSSRTAFTR